MNWENPNVQKVAFAVIGAAGAAVIAWLTAIGFDVQMLCQV